MNKMEDLKKKTISGVVWKGMERILAQLVSAVVTIVLARILVPADYSVVSVVAIFFTFCNIFINGGLNTALVQKKDSDIIDYSTILITNTVMAGVLYAVMFFCAPLIATAFKNDLLVPVIRIMALTFFVNGYKAVLSAKIMSDLRFRVFFWSTLIGTVTSAVVGIVLATRGFGPWALVAQQMTNSVIDSLVLTFTSRIRFRFVFSFDRFKRLFSFGGKILVASIIDSAYNQVKPVIVGIKYSAVDLAYYNKGKTYPDLISNISNDTLSSSLFPAMTKVQDEKDSMLEMVRKFMQLSSFTVFPLMIGFLALSENFVRIVLNENWLPIVPYLMIFAFSNMFKPIQTGNLQAIRALGRSDIILKLEVVKKVSYCIIIALFVIFTNSPVLLAVSGIITSLLASFLNTYPNKKLIGYSYRKQFQDLFLNLISAALMGVGIYFMKYIPINYYLLTVLQVLAGVLLYVGFSLLFHNPNLFYIVRLLKSFFKRKKAPVETTESEGE